MLRKLAGPFIAGLLAALPLALTLAIIVWLVEFIHRFVGPNSAFGRTLRSIGLNFVTSEVVAYLVGVGLTLVLIYLLGVLVEAGTKNRWHAWIENVMRAVPVVGSIYNALEKLIRMFEKKDESELKAMSAVMCHFGGEGGIAVLALMPSPEPIHMHG